MCGRYAASRSPEDLVEELEVEQDATRGTEAAEPDWNVAPTKVAPVVLSRPPRDDPEAAPVRQLRPLTWGLVPSWAKDRSIGSRMINARVETLLEKPSWARVATRRRCLVPADGWYEWQRSPVATDAKGKPRKQPFFTRMAGGGGLALAGVYDFWRDRAKPDDDESAWLVTYSVITAPAEEGLDRLHDRMPFVLPPERWAEWLDPAVTDPERVKALLAPVAPGRFEAYPVSNRVNRVDNNGPELVEPAPLSDLEGVVDPMTGEIIGR